MRARPLAVQSWILRGVIVGGPGGAREPMAELSGSERAKFHGDGRRQRARDPDAGFFGHVLRAATILVPLFLLLTILSVAPILSAR